MLQVTDMTQTRVFQEGREEGLKEGEQKGRHEEREGFALRLLQKRLPIAEIAELTGLTPAQIRKLNKKPRK